MYNHTYPYMIDIYKGEGRFLFIPYLSHTYGGRVQSENRLSMEINDNYLAIGEYAMEAINMIKNSPLATKILSSAEKTALWQKNSKYKSLTSFCNNNHLVTISYFEDGHYKVDAIQHSKEHKMAYIGIIKSFELPAETTNEELGIIIYEALNLAEAVDKGTQNEKNDRIIHLLNGQELRMIDLTDSHFVDSEDAGAAEIYQCYSYIPKDTANSAAEIFLGLASELDGDITFDHIHKVWDTLYGESDFFEIQNVDYGIYKIRVEMRNKNTHKISYILKQDDDLLLECGVVVYRPERRKSLDNKLVQIFERFTLRCSF